MQVCKLGATIDLRSNGPTLDMISMIPGVTGQKAQLYMLKERFQVGTPGLLGSARVQPHGGMCEATARLVLRPRQLYPKEVEIRNMQPYRDAENSRF